MESGEVVSISGIMQPYDWVLVPHVDPAPQRNVERFNRAIRSACGLRPRGRLTSARLGDALRDPQKRKTLRRCYDEITKGGAGYNHNRISMSLYLDPSAFWDGRKSSFVLSSATLGWFGSMPGVELGRSLGVEGAAAGWIGTGDAKLLEEDVRRAWLHTSRPYEKGVMTMLLPHHGSRRDFHSDLLDFSNLSICVASAGKGSQYKHPGLAVVEEVRRRGNRFFHVSQHPESAMHEGLLLYLTS